MNREILFRGKYETGVWHYGHLHIDTLREDDKYYINSSISINNINFIEVIKESVGQYIGLNDKFENKIFEGDIIEEVYKTKHKTGKVIKGKIVYNKDAFEIEWISKDHFNNNIIHVRNEEIEVIGNIHDNKNLLQQKENDRI